MSSSDEAWESPEKGKKEKEGMVKKSSGEREREREREGTATFYGGLTQQPSGHNFFLEKRKKPFLQALSSRRQGLAPLSRTPRKWEMIHAGRVKILAQAKKQSRINSDICLQQDAKMSSIV